MNIKQTHLPEKRELVSALVAELCNQIKQFNFSEKEKKLWNASLCSYAFYWDHYFKKAHDPANLIGQDNFLKYLPREKVFVRFQEGDSLFDILRIIAAVLTCYSCIEVSGEKQELVFLDSLKISNLILVKESEEQFVLRLKKEKNSHIRLLKVPSVILKKSKFTFIQGEVLANGRIELLNYLREVAISDDYHRYGNLGGRENEARKSKNVKS